MKLFVQFQVTFVLGALAAACLISTVSFAGQNDEELFMADNSQRYRPASYMRGKPPYNRSRIRQWRRDKALPSVEFSALEIDENPQAASAISRSNRRARGHHPDRMKRYY
ncbi:MAG: hypothetical protein V3U75_08580 [Methylococcaceae bacterium]